MTTQIRFKGQFTKKKVRDKRLRAVSAMCRANAAKRNENKHNLNEEQQKFAVKEIRIVDSQHLGENFKSIRCRKDIFLRKAVKPTRMELNSNLHISSDECSAVTQIRTEQTHVTSENNTDVDIEAISDAVHSGIEETSFNKLLNCLNITTIESHIFEKYEDEIGPALEAAAKDSCQRAAGEERELVIEKMEQLCQELPQDIVDEIYPFMRTLRTFSNSNLHPGSVENDVDRRETFDTAIGNIVNIIVSYDMGWNKRGNGRSYNSMNGYGTIVGFLSGKVLEFAARNKKCQLCINGHSKSDHDCGRNFSASAKALESDVKAALVNGSSITKEAELSVRVLIGEEDSSTIAEVQEGNLQTIFKLADSNYVKKNFEDDLYNLRKDCKEMRDNEVNPHLQKCFSYASVQSNGRSVELANNIRNTPEHVSVKHENCEPWCVKNDEETHILDVNSKLNVSPGEHTASFAKLLDARRKKEEIKPKLPSTKAQRNLLTRKKQASRKSMEQSEGIQYETNYGIDSCVENTEIVDFQLLLDILPNHSLSVDDCNIIFFHLETSGFSEDSEILQIAAKFENFTFDVYLHPSKPIDADAFRVTGLKYVGGKLYFHGKEVPTIAPRDALVSFQEFLRFSSKPCVLVAHNASFDSSHLLRYIINNGMVESFQSVAGFSDSLAVIKKKLPKRKAEKKSFTLQALARDLLNLELSNEFHEALFDVEALEKLCNAFAKTEDFLVICKPYKQLIMVKLLLPTLKDLKGVISDEMVKRIAGAGIHYEILQNVYLKEGENGIKTLLSEKTISKKPRVTQAEKVIDNVVNHLRNKLQFVHNSLAIC